MKSDVQNTNEAIDSKDSTHLNGVSDEIDQVDQTDEIDQTDQINETDEIDKIDETTKQTSITPNPTQLNASIS